MLLRRVNALLETEVPTFLENHGDILSEAMLATNNFQEDIKTSILKNPEEFIGENVEETYKNMRVFAEVATAQFISEISNLYNDVIQQEESIRDKGIAEYL